jgi:hypothetical protein
MKLMKSKLTSFVLGGIVLFSTSYFLSKLAFFEEYRVKYDKAYSAFLNENVVGIIKEVDYRDHAISIELMDGRFYLCDPYNSNGIYFEKEANKGDSIVKMSGKDYLRLKKRNGKNFTFKFRDRTITNDFYKSYE